MFLISKRNNGLSHTFDNFIYLIRHYFNMNHKDLMKENLAKKISGEIVLSPNPGLTIKKWRNIFKISQKEIAKDIGIMPSVLSDYENGRRSSPGVKVVKKIVQSMIKISEERGVLDEFYTFTDNENLSDVMTVKEFKTPLKIEKFCEDVGCSVVVREDLIKNEIYGYSLIDSLKAIIQLSPNDFIKIYGLTTNRALVFMNVSRGRSPLVAIKITNLKPALVVLQGPEKIDELAKRIAETEGIPLAVTYKDPEEIRRILNTKYNDR